MKDQFYLQTNQLCQITKKLRIRTNVEQNYKTKYMVKRQMISNKLPVSAAVDLSVRLHRQLFLNADALSHVNCQHFGLLLFYLDLGVSNNNTHFTAIIQNNTP